MGWGEKGVRTDKSRGIAYYAAADANRGCDSSVKVACHRDLRPPN
jgi:hypothetical protein